MIILDLARNCILCLSFTFAGAASMATIKSRVRMIESRVLSDDWYLLKKNTFDFLRNDGTWQRQNRETYDRGDGATILLYSRAKQTVLLTRQFHFRRLPTVMTIC